MRPAAPKPRFGDPCNGCGVCCIAVPCVLARDLVGAVEGPCPALEHDGARYWCGLLRAPHKYVIGLSEKPWADDILIRTIETSGAFGRGCDSADPDPRDGAPDDPAQKDP